MLHRTEVSIIVPVYNAETTIRRCIDSIRTQTFQNFELILVDDGSTDQSGFICDEYSKNDKRIKTVHKMNGGVSSARNMGLNISKGIKITFVDSDDYLDKDFISRMIIKTSDLVVCGYYKDKEPILNEEFKCENDLMKFCIQKNYISFFKTPWAKLYDNQLIKDNNLRFDESISFGEDYLFVMNYVMCSKSVQLISYAGYYETDQPKSLSKSAKNVYESVNRLLTYVNSTDAVNYQDEYVYFTLFCIKTILYQCKNSFDIFRENINKILKDYDINKLSYDNKYFSKVDKIRLFLLNRKYTKLLYFVYRFV